MKNYRYLYEKHTFTLIFPVEKIKKKEYLFLIVLMVIIIYM